MEAATILKRAGGRRWQARCVAVDDETDRQLQKKRKAFVAYFKLCGN